jgi:uncharacterized membrane protein HdeD (DUF308 family)
MLLFSTPFDKIYTVAITLGFMALFGGIERLALLGTPGLPHKGALAFNGVIQIIVGIVFLSSPLASWIALGYILGIYLIVQGVAFVIEVLTKK